MKLCLLSFGLLLLFCTLSTGFPFEGFDNGNAFPSVISNSLHQFAFQVYGKISADARPEENLLFSPISMYSVLSLLVPGLNGPTLKQVERALRSEEIDDLSKEESLLCRDIFEDEQANHTLTQTSRVFIDKHFQIYKSFKAVNERNNRSSFKKMPFQEHPKKARSRINKYITKATHHEIEEFVPEGVITQLTKMFLVSTIYMEAQWANAFDESYTTSEDFIISSSKTIQVEMMRKTSSKCSVFNFVDDINAQMVVLPFKEKALSMVILMPNDPGNFSPFEQENSADKIKAAMGVLWFEGYPFLQRCQISMPKFSINHSIDNLKGTLEEMGISDLFIEGQADFSRMSPEKPLFVSDARHEAAIKVSESGVKATAVSSINVGFRMGAESVRLNKPFLFFIRHEQTGAVLFLGKVVKPEYSE